MIAVFQKQPNESNLFLTTCKLTIDKRAHLISTNGNFLMERIIQQQKAFIPIKSIPIIQENFHPNPEAANCGSYITCVYR